MVHGYRAGSPEVQVAEQWHSGSVAHHHLALRIWVRKPLTSVPGKLRIFWAISLLAGTLGKVSRSISRGIEWKSVPDPSAVSTPGWYNVDGYDWSGCSYWGSFEVVSTPQIALGPDLAVDHCSGAGPLDLSTLFSLAGLQPAWSLDGSPITTATASAATTPGVYELIVQNNGGCGDTALVTLDIVTGPMLGADQSMNICPGGSANLHRFV